MSWSGAEMRLKYEWDDLVVKNGQKNKGNRLQPVTSCDTWHNYLTLNKV